MIQTSIKALAMQVLASNRSSNCSLTELGKLSNFPSNFPDKPEQKLDEKLDKNSFEQWEADQEKVAQKYARHYLFPEPEVSDSERKDLKMIYQETINNGSYLHDCEDAAQAERFRQYLMHHLPQNRSVCLIRDFEVNTFSTENKC